MSRSVALILGMGLTLVLTLVPVRGGPADPPDPSAETIVLRRCVIEYEHSSTIGSTSYSTLEECTVEPGSVVKAGQMIGRLLSDDVRAEVALREAEAASDVDIRLSEARSAKAQAKLQRTAALITRNAASREEFYENKLDAAAAELEVEKAKYQRRLSAIHLQQARATLRTRELISPHDGVVTTIFKRRGEAVAPRDPIFQVVDADHLRVVGQVDVTDVWRLKLGQAVRVIPDVAGVDLPIEHEVFPGRLTFIDSQIDPLTRTCKVFVSAENHGRLLRAGIEARVEIDPAPPAVTGGNRPPRT